MSRSVKVVSRSVKVVSRSVKVVSRSVKVVSRSVKVVSRSVKVVSRSVKVDYRMIKPSAFPANDNLYRSLHKQRKSFKQASLALSAYIYFSSFLQPTTVIVSTSPIIDCTSRVPPKAAKLCNRGYVVRRISCATSLFAINNCSCCLRPFTETFSSTAASQTSCT